MLDPGSSITDKSNRIWIQDPRASTEDPRTLLREHEPSILPFDTKNFLPGAGVCYFDHGLILFTFISNSYELVHDWLTICNEEKAPQRIF